MSAAGMSGFQTAREITRVDGEPIGSAALIFNPDAGPAAYLGSAVARAHTLVDLLDVLACRGGDDLARLASSLQPIVEEIQLLAEHALLKCEDRK